MEGMFDNSGSSLEVSWAVDECHKSFVFFVITRTVFVAVLKVSQRQKVRGYLIVENAVMVVAARYIDGVRLVVILVERR